ncbi:MAG: extracellular solute-binding protein [Candidatus Paceibacterota bacterium]
MSVLRTYGIALFTLLLSIIVVSCGGQDEGVSISVIGEDSSTIQSIQALAPEYKEETGIDVNVQGYTFEESFDRVNVDFSSGTGRYDIVLQYNFSLSSFVRNDYVYQLEELKEDYPDSLFSFEEDLFRNSWEEVGFYYSDPANRNGETEPVGYPFASNTMVLAYNKEMFNNQLNRQRYREQYDKELAPPSTWNEFYDIAQFFTVEENNTYGVTMHGSASGWLYYEWVNYAFGMGGGIMDKERAWQGDQNRPVTINSPENIRSRG